MTGAILAVTGATGFVGQAVVDAAIAAGHRVRALTRHSQPPRDGVEWVAGTLETADALARLVAGADAVLHIAGAVNVPSRAAFAAANIAGTQAMVDAAGAAGVRRFVHVSSLAAREPALSNYGWSKAGAEAVVAASSLDWTMVRPPGVYGPRDADMLDIFRMARRGVVLLPPAGRVSLIMVADLAELLLALALTAGDRAIYEPDDGSGGMSHIAMATAIGDALGRRVRTISAPAALIRLAARVDRLLRGTRARLTPDRASYLCHPDWVSDPARAVPPALWQPRWPTAAGMAETARWYRAAGWL